MKRMNEQETRNTNGGMGTAALIIWGMSIAAPYAGIAWEAGKSLGTAIGNKLFK